MSLLNLIVLRCSDIDRTREFYESFRVCFDKHRYGNGAEHYGSANDPAVLIELYPATTAHPADLCGLGFGVGRRVEVQHDLCKDDPQFAQEIKARIADYEKNPKSGIPWRGVMRQLK